MNTFTIEGTLKNAKNEALANKYIKFRIMSVGTDTEDDVTYPKETVEFQTDTNGDFTGTLWVNGDSGVDCAYEIKLPNKGQRVQVIIPSAVAGSTVRLEDIIESYQVTASTQQSTVLDAALAYTNSLAADPSSNGNFSATEWRTDLGLVIGTDVQAYDATILVDADIGVNVEAHDATILKDADIGSTVQAYDAGLADLAGLTPTNESIIKGDGTNWVAATNFRVDAGTAGSGTEMGTGTANGARSVAEGNSTDASGDASHAEGDSTTAIGTSSHAEGGGTTASGNYSHAEGFLTTASGDYSHAEGSSSTASGDYSSATGRRAKAIHDGARVEADSQDADVSSTTTDQYTARFQNGYSFLGGDAVFAGDVQAVEVTGTTKVATPDVEATTSAGVTISNSAGTPIIIAGGGVGTGTSFAGGVTITGQLTVNGDTVIATETPATAAATGTAGQIAWDASYIYVAIGTNIWKRVAIATW